MSFGHDTNGDWTARVHLPADEGEVVADALRRMRARLHATARAAAKAAAAAEQGRSTEGTDVDLGVEPVTWADALVGVAKASVGCDGKGAEATSRAQVLLHLEAPTPGCGDQWRANIHGGPTLPASLRRYLTCDADLHTIWEHDSAPVATSARTRIVPRWIRRLVEHRDNVQCQVPACGTTIGLQTHHIIHWEDGGDTLTHNLVTLCGRHHRLHHTGHLEITGNPDLPHRATGALAFADRYGRPIHPSPPPPPTADQMPDVAAYVAPTGETLHKKWAHFTRTPPDPAESPTRNPVLTT